MLAFLLSLLFAALMIRTAYGDLTNLLIPNWLSITLAVMFIPAWWVGGGGFDILAYHLLIGGLVLAAGFGLFACGVIGGGDVKIAAATALWLGPALLDDYFIAFALIGGVLALIILIMRRFPLPNGIAKHIWIGRHPENKEGVPYGIALASGGLLVYLQTPIYAAALSWLTA